MAPRRVYNNSNNNNSGRVVTLGGKGGGLNERFSQLDKSKKTSSPQQGNVFSRIQRGNNNNAKPGRRNPTSIQSRLSRPVGGGIRKRNNAPVQAVKRGNNQRNSRPVNSRRVAGGNRVTQQRSSNRGPSNNNKQQSQQQRGGGGGGNRNSGRGGRSNNNNNNKGKKPVTAQDLDKSLDDYMMKDPQTAQSRLDAELNSYMDESGDVLMDL